MKRAGILGGLSWESTITYYRIINEAVGARLGASSSADMIIRSLDLALIDYHQSRGEWSAVSEILCGAAAELEQMGADFILMASNTVHRVYDDVQASVSVPVLHIADSLIAALKEVGIEKAGLLGTRYTMEGDFLAEKLEAAGIAVVVPDEEDFAPIHEVIFTENFDGQTSREVKDLFRRVISGLEQKGAQGIILGCTELGLAINEEDSCLPLFDTAVLHAKKAAEEILK